MRHSVKRIVLVASAVVLVSGVYLSAQMATRPGAGSTEARTQQQMVKELQASARELQSVMKPLPELMDEKVRAEVAPQARPPLKKMVEVLGELQGSLKEPAPELTTQRAQMQAMLFFLGDTSAGNSLEQDAQSQDATTARSGQLSLAMAEWWQSNKDAAAQGKVLDRMQEIAAANPDEEEVAGTLRVMSKLGAASPEVRSRAAKMAAVDPPEEGKPLAVSGPTIDGKQLNTADLKGKVVVLDFWATWCGPCRAELPKMIKLYQKYHSQGMEIVGISLDRSAEDLKTFLTENKDVSWPQIFDPKQPLAKRFGVDAIPTVYVIDREGNLQTTEARGQLEELVPKLLAEKPGHGAAAQESAK